MLRRCLQSAVPKFGMIMPPRTNGEGTEFGTILEIRTVQMFPDGRSMVETLGIGRFRLLETGSLDGYMVGRIELYALCPCQLVSSLIYYRIEDLPQGVDDESNTSSASLSIEHNALPLITTGSLDQDVPATNEELMNVCRTFLEKLRTCSAPWVIQRLNHAYGPEPENPSYFSFWMALVCVWNCRRSYSHIFIMNNRSSQLMNMRKLNCFRFVPHVHGCDSLYIGLNN